MIFIVKLFSQLLIVLLSWVLYMELVLYTTGTGPTTVQQSKLQILCFIGPVLLAVPSTLYDTYLYVPGGARVMCLYASPLGKLSSLNYIKFCFYYIILFRYYILFLLYSDSYYDWETRSASPLGKELFIVKML